MVIRIQLLALAGLLCLLGISPAPGPSPHATRPQLSNLTDQRVAFLGGTLISRMEQYGYLEAALTAAWADQEVTFRNLGWPGDDILGTARGEFGSKRNSALFITGRTCNATTVTSSMAKANTSAPTFHLLVPT